MSKFLEEADIVVVAQLTSATVKSLATRQESGHIVQGQEYEGLLQVQSVYKGSLEPGELTLDYFVPTEFFGTSYVSVNKGKPSLFFLKEGAESRIELFYPSRPYFPVLENRPSPKVGRTAVQYVEAELLQNIEEGKVDLAVRSFDVLWKSDKGLYVAKDLVESDKALIVKAAATSYRMRFGDATAIDDMVEIMEEAQGQDLSVVSGTLSLALLNVANKITPVQAKRLVSTKSPDVLSSLSLIIQQDKTSRFVFIAGEILKLSKDKDAQYDAILTLSRLRSAEAPSLDDFAKNSGKYVEEYSKWWEKEGVEKYGDGAIKK